ncbi:MAG TPA: hypothetical protein VIE89_21550 [Candidatus Binatia bacterium]
MNALVIAASLPTEGYFDSNSRERHAHDDCGDRWRLKDRVFTPGNPRNQALQAVLWRLGAETQARSLTTAIGLMMAVGMLVAGRKTQPQRDLFIVAAWLAWIVVIAPLSHFDYHMLMLFPMTVLAYLALANTGSVLTSLARVTLVVYLLASVCALALIRLQYIGLLSWTTLGLWAVLILVAVRTTHVPGV